MDKCLFICLDINECEMMSGCVYLFVWTLMNVR